MIRLAQLAAASLLVSGCTSLAPHGTAGAAGNAAVTTAPAAASSAPTSAAATAFVTGATAMLGRPYRYGGADPSGFDCSGLVTYAASRIGMQLPRTTREQLHVGTEVGRDALVEGDLVFMRLAAKELHVGIALDASRFVHAPSAGASVRIDSLDAPPYVHGFLTARRPDFPR